MFVGSSILMLGGAIPFGIGLFNGIDWLIKLVITLEVIPLMVMCLSHARLDYPHCPKMAYEDVESMKLLGIPDPVIDKAMGASLTVNSNIVERPS